MKGEYYVFCRYCSVSVYNTDSRLDHEGKWQCKEHTEDSRYSNKTGIPTDHNFRPAIVRKPSSTYQFKDQALTWEFITCLWEDTSDNWEEA